jgi:hypothetical protein
MGETELSDQITVKKDEVGFLYVESLPETAFRCRSVMEFYRLKPKKKKHTSDNIEINEGCMYLLKATRSDRYYLRNIHATSDPYSLIDRIRQGKIWLLYTEEVAEAVRKSVESSGLGYSKYLLRAEAYMNEERVEDTNFWNTGKVTNRMLNKYKT